MISKRLYSLQDGKCFYCKKELIPKFPGQKKDLDDNPTRDHIVPKSKNGLGLDDNTVMACNKCNSTRGNISFIEFISKIGYFNEIKA